MHITNCPLSEAIDMASGNPARLLGLADRGEIKRGKRADLIRLTFTQSNFSIKDTIISGEVVYTTSV